jgi:hypothetical protein
MVENLEGLTKEDIIRIIKESKKDPDNVCLLYGTSKCSNPPCTFEGYSGTLICVDYINKRHLEFFKKYNII